MGEDVETLKRRMPLLDYLRQHNWIARPAGRSEFVGLCPLHQESRPSFYVNTRKDVFYCHGCGQGGDLIRFVQLSRHLSFRQSLACLDPQTSPEADSAAVLEQAAAFYQQQLDHYPEALQLSRQAWAARSRPDRRTRGRLRSRRKSAPSSHGTGLFRRPAADKSA